MCMPENVEQEFVELLADAERTLTELGP